MWDSCGKDWIALENWILNLARSKFNKITLCQVMIAKN
jgi:hypothetical protein